MLCVCSVCVFVLPFPYAIQTEVRIILACTFRQGKTLRLQPEQLREVGITSMPPLVIDLETGEEAAGAALRTEGAAAAPHVRYRTLASWA